MTENQLPLYRGKLLGREELEHCAAVYRDVLARHILQLENQGYSVAFCCQDEIVLEAPEGVSPLDGLASVTADAPEWWREAAFLNNVPMTWL